MHFLLSLLAAALFESLLGTNNPFPTWSIAPYHLPGNADHLQSLQPMIIAQHIGGNHLLWSLSKLPGLAEIGVLFAQPDIFPKSVQVYHSTKFPTESGNLPSSYPLPKTLFCSSSTLVCAHDLLLPFEQLFLIHLIVAGEPTVVLPFHIGRPNQYMF